MAAETAGTLRRSPWLFLFGVVVFFGSIVLFLFDLSNGNDAGRGALANGAAAALLVVLAGLETLSDPESQIGSRGEAVRAMLFFYGLYLVVAGAVVLVGALVGQPAPRLGAGGVAVGGVSLVVTFLTGGAESGTLSRLSTLAGFLGVVLVICSLVLFVSDIVTGADVLRGIVLNGVGAALFVLWTAYDMPADPDSGVESLPDALGVSLLLYGGYLLAAGATVAATGLVAHGRGPVGLLYLVLAVLPLLVGFLLAPLESLTRDGEPVTAEEPSE